MAYEHERKENVTSTNEPRENTYEGMIHEGTREVVIFFWLKPFSHVCSYTEKNFR
jgi:hypothetical protein